LQDYFLPALVELTHIDVRKAGIWIKTAFHIVVVWR
jgi:hypothetical protein